MSLTIAPVHNSAGWQAQSSVSSTLSPKRDPTTEDPDETSSVSSISASQDKGDKQACTSKLHRKINLMSRGVAGGGQVLLQPPSGG